jgi:uncharacterized membrane protein
VVETTVFSSQNQVQVFLWSPNTVNGTLGSIFSVSGPDNNAGTAPAINNYGQVGGYLNGNWGIWTPNVPNGSTGTITNNSQSQSLTKINDFGQAIASEQSYPQRGLLFTPSAANQTTGTFTSIPGLAGSTQDVLQAINDKGTIVGYSCLAQPLNSACQNHGFIWTPTTLNGVTGATAEIALALGR